MLGYRRKSFSQVHALLRKIAEFPQDISKVLSCQHILLQEILQAEAKISRHKDELRAARVTLKTSRPDRSDARRLKRRIKWIESRIQGYRQLIYIWRCFGDGIAFSYLDKYAIKHVFYETATVAVNQDAGFMSGKEGLAKEIMLVVAAAKAGVPSVLVDLTNSIRHGDVCLLGGSDPYLIEVKKGIHLNGRGKRQAADIKKLHAFYENDVGVGLRGYPELRRVTVHVPERCYVDEMNACIDHAERAGFCLANPEPGLYYAAIYGARCSMRTLFRSMTVEAPLVFLLNMHKSTRTWSPYRPFTLSIKKKDHLYDFIRGGLILVVIVDVAVLCRKLAARNLDAMFDDQHLSLSFSDSKTGESGGISGHLLHRIGLEFVSPSWVVDSLTNSLERWRTSLPVELHEHGGCAIAAGSSG
jgi:hypothetical protein